MRTPLDPDAPSASDAELSNTEAGQPLSVVLVGPPGAGKSTIGRKLARELGLDLYDTDAGIEEQTGRTIPEIFAEDGEPEFRRIEEQVVRDAVLAGHGIISLGGGSVLSAATRELLHGRTVVYLEISVGEGLRRTGASTNRPLLNGDDPAKKYRELMKIRRPLYREVASVRVRTDGRSPGRVVRMILTKLGMESDLPEELPTPEPTTPAPEDAGKSRSRRRRRRGRGRGDATITTNSTVAESDSSTTTAPADTHPSDDQQEPTPKRRRSRRSRRRGRAADTLVGTTTDGADATAGATIASPGTGAAIAANSSADSSSSQRNSAVHAPGDTTGSSADAAKQPASGTPAAPGAGRSRRARARRARARARQQSAEQNSFESTTASAPNSSAPTGPAPAGSAQPNPASAPGESS